jgi:hypothetical protein
MPYIGNQPSESFTSFATQEFSTSATTSYTLDHAVTNENEIALFVNNVRQQPGSGKAYTATGTALTLSAATASTDTMYCVFLGRALQTVTPATNSITNAMITDNTIESGKLFSTFKNGITEADQWRLTTSFTGDADPIASNLERVDNSGWGKLGTGMSESSGIFTFPSTGIWFVKFRLNTSYTGQNRYATARIEITTNNSSYGLVASSDAGMENSSGATIYQNTLTETLIDCTDTSNVKVKFVVANEDDSTTVVGNTDISLTSMMFIRLGDT